MKEQINHYIDSITSELLAMADEIFDNPEMGFKEYKACKLLTAWLQKNGFAVTTGVGGVETAFRAVYERGSNGPSIGLLCEYDALPMGHGCGHHMQGPVILGAAAALMKSSAGDQPFKLVVYGTPAEEILLGKPEMLKGGCFKDIDLAFMMHSGANTSIITRSLTGVNLRVVFQGRHAHDTAAPWMNRSGFDAMILALEGVGLLRGHIKDGVRLFQSVNDCIGIPSNHDSSRASANFSVRTYQAEDVPELEERLRAILNGAAMMTETRAAIEKTLEVMGTNPSHTLNGILLSNAEILNAPQIIPERKGGGSNDFANITHLMPGATIYVAFVPAGTASHTQEWLDAGKSPTAHASIVLGAKILAGGCADLIQRPELVKKAREEFVVWRRDRLD
jgi:Metal-dependent amidase/aminoacylase/carboxypeptidase